MKQKSVNEEPVTKKDLLEALQGFGEDFSRKIHQEITTEIKASERRILAKVAVKFADSEQNMEDKMSRQTSIVMSRFDQWAGTLDDIRTDQTVTNKQIEELQKDVHNNKKRITKLEHN